MEVQELLKKEKDYQEANRDLPYIINEYGEFQAPYVNNDLSFLMKGYQSKHYESIADETWDELRAKGLTDFEILMLVCFEGFLSYAFRWPSYQDMPSPIHEMCKGLDSVLDKAPRYIDNKVLYRFCTTDDRLDFADGETCVFPHYLTTTKDCWRPDDNMYIITPKKDSTNARCVCELRNHGEENQVTFKRGTRFQITDIQEDGVYKKFFMKEL